MITVRRSDERDLGDHGWLYSRHTFSFAGYQDPDHMGFHALRVINEDRVKPGAGFGRHGHRDMEIISYVLEGELAHEDSAGHKQTLRPGMVQFMSAGRGILHSEFNGSKTDPVHFLQIWIFPAKEGEAPRYEDRDFSEKLASGAWTLLVSPDGREGSLVIGQDALFHAARPKAGATLEYKTSKDRGIWIQVARGSVEMLGETLTAGDGAAIEGEDSLSIAVREDAELLLFDLQ